MFVGDFLVVFVVESQVVFSVQVVLPHAQRVVRQVRLAVVAEVFTHVACRDAGLGFLLLSPVPYPSTDSPR